jgi:hypothetical protein
MPETPLDHLADINYRQTDDNFSDGRCDTKKKRRQGL